MDNNSVPALEEAALQWEEQAPHRAGRYVDGRAWMKVQCLPQELRSRAIFLHKYLRSFNVSTSFPVKQKRDREGEERKKEDTKGKGSPHSYKQKQKTMDESWKDEVLESPNAHPEDASVEESSEAPQSPAHTPSRTTATK